MKRRFASVAVAFLLLAGVSGSAQTTVSAPLTEWPIPFDLRPLTARLDRHGSVWTMGVGHFPIQSDSGIIGNFFAAALVRLVPRTNTFTYWPLPTQTTTDRVAPAPDDTVFFCDCGPNAGGTNDVSRLDPATGLVTTWHIPALSTSELIRDFSPFDLAIDPAWPQRPYVWISGIFAQTADGCPSNFSQQTINQVTRLNPQTGDVVNYSWPAAATPCGSSGEHVITRLAVQANGTVWLGATHPVGTLAEVGGVMALDPASGAVTIYFDVYDPYVPVFVDPKGAVYLPQCTARDAIVRFRESIDVVSYDMPTYNHFPHMTDSAPCDLALGAKVYFAETNGNKVGRFDPAVTTGVVSGPVSPTTITAISVITAAPSSVALRSAISTAVTSSTTTVVSTVSNGFEEFVLPTANSFPDGIAITPCSAFFTELATMRVGRLKTSAEEPIRGLQDIVDALAGGSALTQGQAGSLTAKLDRSLSAFNDAMPRVARNVLGAFINETNALVESGALSQPQGGLLISPANAIVQGCTFLD